MRRSTIACLTLVTALVSAAPLSSSLVVNEPASLGKRWSTQGIYPLSAATLTVEYQNETKVFYSPLLGYNYTFTSSLPGDLGWIPVTVFKVEGAVTCDSLSSLITTYQQTDDVFDEIFLGGIVLSSSKPITSTASLESCFSGVSFVVSAGGGGFGAYLAGSAPPAGPFLASVSSTGSVTLFKVWRSFRDEQQAFTEATYPLPTDPPSFASYASTVEGMNTVSIGVPSRLYYTKTAEQPLAGLRFGLKDIYDARGLRTGDGNRAYYNFYPPRSNSSVVVDRLVAAGAILVGKTKASQFANGETATADWVDQMCPFNPRGDGYQDPSSSSSGSGASMGAYDWIDFTIGSDTGGSIRGPAGQQGVYGLRPSWSAISLANVMPLNDIMDTAGGFARDAKSFQLLHETLYGDRFKKYKSFPKKLIVSTDQFPVSNNVSQPYFADFISKVQSFLGASIDNRTIAARWNSTGQNATYGALPTYLNQTYPTLIGAYQYFNFSAPWISAYQAANDGRVPFIDPAPLVRWAYGRGRGQSGYNDEVARKEVFKSWINSEIFPANNDSCSDTIYLYAQSSGNPSPRNVYLSPPKVPFGYSAGRIGPFASTPDMVVPFAQVPYNSTITNHTEVLPITMSMIARYECDYMLLDLAAALEDAGLLSSVKVGKTAY